MDKPFTIRDLPASERPRERLQRCGAEALSAQELIAVLLGRGIAGESVMVTAQRLLGRFGSFKGIAQATIEELAEVRGIGLAKAAQLKAAFELANRLKSDPEPGQKQLVRNPAEAFTLVQGRLRGKKKEYFLAILLDTRGQVIRVAEVSIGSLDASIVHPREVFKEAMLASAASVLFVHNHPSGDTEPSPEDIEITKRLVETGKMVGIDVLDHIIVSDDSYLSLKGRGVV